MQFASVSVFLWLIRLVFGTEHQYKLIQEKIEIEYVNNNYVDITAGLLKFNDTANILNITFLTKVDFPANFKFLVTGLKSFHNEYKLRLFHYNATLKDAIEMEFFDIQSLCLEYSRPPLVWPLQKNIVYRIEGWTPDYAKWLPNFPEGKWKFQIINAFTNKTKTLVLNWFLRIEN